LLQPPAVKKNFLTGRPKDAITLDNFYQTNDQVTGQYQRALQLATWFGWVAKSGWAITELTSGNGRTYSDDVNFIQFFGNQRQPAYCRCLELLVHGTVAQANALDQQSAKKGVPNGKQSAIVTTPLARHT
jgi:hypothetical protein